MARIGREIYINASPTEVFNLLCHVEEMPRWECNSGPVELLRVERLGGVMGSGTDKDGLAVGTIIRQYRMERGKLTTYDSEVTEYEPDRVIAWRSLQPPENASRFEIAPQEKGTLLRASASVRLSWLLELLFPLLFRPAFERILSCSQERFRSILTTPTEP